MMNVDRNRLWQNSYGLFFLVPMKKENPYGYIFTKKEMPTL